MRARFISLAAAGALAVTPAGAAAAATGGSFFSGSLGPPAVAALSRPVQMPAAGKQMPPLAPVAHSARSAWSLQSTALPSVSQGNLFADACSSPASCIAVGTFEDSSGKQVPLAERWNGTTWSVQAAPSPAGATDSELDGISCASAASCLAVGFSGAQALAEEWNGTTWTIQSTPTPSVCCKCVQPAREHQALLRHLPESLPGRAPLAWSHCGPPDGKFGGNPRHAQHNWSAEPLSRSPAGSSAVSSVVALCS
jgi:hypothetical protein